MHRCMIGTKAVFVIAIVDGHFDGDRGVNKTNDRGWYANEVGAPAVCSTSESADRKN